MAIRKDGTELSQNDERNTGLSRQGDMSEAGGINDEDNLDTTEVSSDVEEGDEDYDDEELAEDDFEVDEEEDVDDDTTEDVE